MENKKQMCGQEDCKCGQEDCKCDHDELPPADTTRAVATDLNPKRPRGFAAMDPVRLREIASRGGRIGHARRSSNEFTHDQAVAAGRKGGLKVSQDRKHMKEIGRKGGAAKALRALGFCDPEEIPF